MQKEVFCRVVAWHGVTVDIKKEELCVYHVRCLARSIYLDVHRDNRLSHATTIFAFVHSVRTPQERTTTRAMVCPFALKITTRRPTGDTALRTHPQRTHVCCLSVEGMSTHTSQMCISNVHTCVSQRACAWFEPFSRSCSHHC